MTVKFSRKINAEPWKLQPIPSTYLTAYSFIVSESTNNRVLFFSIFGMLCLIGLALWQVLYLRRFFKAKKLIEWGFWFSKKSCFSREWLYSKVKDRLVNPWKSSLKSLYVYFRLHYTTFLNKTIFIARGAYLNCCWATWTQNMIKFENKQKNNKCKIMISKELHIM